MAAGLGFKNFTSGSVLTAAEVNGYLMQGINVFASTAARDAAITAPAEGQFAFTKDTNGLWYYDGATWIASGATGDIEGVTAGVGISGGGTSGTVTVTNSMATAIDAKGDLIGGTGADTFSRLAVGANNTVLTADSAEATGLKWAAPASSPFVGCVLFATSAQNIANNTDVLAAFGAGTEAIDTDGFHDTTTNNSRITIPTGKGGKYLVNASCRFGAPSGTKQITIFKNGAELEIARSQMQPDTIMMLTFNVVIELNAGDYIEVVVYQATGATLGMPTRNFMAYYLGA
jgi:hypothetical protein